MGKPDLWNKSAVSVRYKDLHLGSALTWIKVLRMIWASVTQFLELIAENARLKFPNQSLQPWSVSWGVHWQPSEPDLW